MNFISLIRVGIGTIRDRKQPATASSIYSLLSRTSTRWHILPSPMRGNVVNIVYLCNIFSDQAASSNQPARVILSAMKNKIAQPLRSDGALNDALLPFLWPAMLMVYPDTVTSREEIDHRNNVIDHVTVEHLSKTFCYEK